MFGLVDNLVISDMTVVTSLDGMECLVLLAKTYTDIGQPRRAWLMWRRGLAFAQLLVCLPVFLYSGHFGIEPDDFIGFAPRCFSGRCAAATLAGHLSRRPLHQPAAGSSSWL